MCLNWNITREDHELLMKVVYRVLREFTRFKHEPDAQRMLVMDLTACHCNGCPLDFAGMLTANLIDLSHDIHGIQHAINRDTGRLECFVPRYALANHESEADARLRVGNTPTCEDCGLPQDHCICAEREGSQERTQI